MGYRVQSILLALRLERTLARGFTIRRQKLQVMFACLCHTYNIELYFTLLLKLRVFNLLRIKLDGWGKMFHLKFAEKITVWQPECKRISRWRMPTLFPNNPLSHFSVAHLLFLIFHDTWRNSIIAITFWSYTPTHQMLFDLRWKATHLRFINPLHVKPQKLSYLSAQRRWNNQLIGDFSSTRSQIESQWNWIVDDPFQWHRHNHCQWR